jgi:hypothetical protein
LRRDDHSPAQFLNVLRDDRRYYDALQFLAHALPVREAVWWGCVCLEATQGHTLSAVERAVVDAVVHWILDPRETNRRAVNEAGQRAGPFSAAAKLAGAAYSSGGLMPPGSTVSAPPPPGLFAHTLYGAVAGAAETGSGLDFLKNYRQCIALGDQIAQGNHLWTIPADAAKG